MTDRKELLKTMLQDIINDRQENASVTMHDYFVAKTRDVTGLAGPEMDEPVDDGIEYDDSEDDSDKEVQEQNESDDADTAE